MPRAMPARDGSTGPSDSRKGSGGAIAPMVSPTNGHKSPPPGVDPRASQVAYKGLVTKSKLSYRGGSGLLVSLSTSAEAYTQRKDVVMQGILHCIVQLGYLIRSVSRNALAKDQHTKL